jgi:hypothetical protein
MERARIFVVAVHKSKSTFIKTGIPFHDQNDIIKARAVTALCKMKTPAPSFAGIYDPVPG